MWFWILCGLVIWICVMSIVLLFIKGYNTGK